MPPVLLGPSTTAEEEKKTSEAIQHLAAARKCECPCDCYDIVNKLPTGYRIVRAVDVGAPGHAGEILEQGGLRFVAELNGLRPSRWLTWDSAHCVWRPPGFTPEVTDPGHLFNSSTGQNAVWDDKKQQWIDTKTGKSLGYDQ